MILNTDGGARGNPGPGAAAFVLRNLKGEVIHSSGKLLGTCTNNEAEYQGLILGLREALAFSAKEVTVNMDSELVIKQLTGQYRVKEPRMQTFYKAAKELEKKFKSVKYAHIPRSQNKLADQLVNQTLDSMVS